MNITNNNICKWFVIIALPVIAIWTAIALNNAFNEQHYLLKKTLNDTQINDSHTSLLVEKELTKIIENLKLIRDSQEFNTFLANNSEQNYQQALQFFVLVMNNKAGHEQLRFINNDGREVIRVDNKDATVVIPADQLQNKANRYYFSHTIQLQNNQVYISPLDLNIENGEIEKPYKPALRFATPVYDVNNQLHGILIINYNAQEFMNLINTDRSHPNFSSSDFYVLNGAGQFIIHPDQDKFFSFMFAASRDLSFKNEQPALWNEMLANDFIGSHIAEHKSYSYYDVLTDSKKNNKLLEQRWILLHVLDTTELLSWKTLFRTLFLTANTIIFAMIVSMSLVLAYFIERLLLTDQQLDTAKKIADAGNDAMVIIDRETRITYANKAYEETTGYQLEELIGSKASQFQSSKQNKDSYHQMWQAINQQGYWEGMLWDKKKDGLLSPKKLKVIAVKNKRSHEVDRYVGIFSDLSSNKMQADTFAMLKHQDGKIIIPNESMMIELLEQSVNNIDFSFTIVYLAIENFNRVLSAFDEDVNHVSEVFISVIRRLIKQGDVVAQTGRNLFAVIIEMHHIDTTPEIFVKNFHKQLSKVFEIDGREIFFKIRMGVSYWPLDTNDIKKLLLNSRVALDWTARRGESDIAFFNEAMIAELNQENEIEGQLRKAIEKNELTMVYQPQIDILTGQLIGMEALIRWHNHALGEVSPMIFIPIAEKSNLMIDIGNWVVQAVCADLKQMKKHQGMAARQLRCAINISAIQMAEADFTDKFFACVAANQINSHELELEITESSLLSNESKSIELLKVIREQGITVAIDDFGTGYSSLSYLQNLPVDKIKIDRSFIKNYPESDDGTLAKILVEMAKTLQMQVLTEGAETKEQVDYLRTISCNYIQGYYYSKPLPLNAFISYASTNYALQKDTTTT